MRQGPAGVRTFGAMSTAQGPDRDRREDPSDDGAADTSAPRGGLLGGTTRLQLLGEVGIVGVIVMVLSLPVVTAVPAVAAGSLHLRRHLSGEPDSYGLLVRGFGRAVRELWWLGLLLPVVLGLTGWNLWLAWSGVLPGGALIGTVSVAVGVVAVVVALRTAGTWHPGSGGTRAVRGAAQRAGRDPVGSVLLVVAVALCAVLVWMLEAFVLLVGGLLAMAAVSVEHRWATHGPDGVER
jgi:hypothetical protein